MNMLLKADGTVTFTSTLFALIRNSLQIKMEGPIEQCNCELKAIVLNLWRGTPAWMLDPIFLTPALKRVFKMINAFYASNFPDSNFLLAVF